MFFTDIAAAQAALANPATSAQDLMSIAQTYPSLWVNVARHPNAYSDLLTWLDQVGGDDVRQAIADRGVLSSLPPIPLPPTTAEPSTPITVPPADMQSGLEQPASISAAPADDSGSFGWAVLGFFIPVVGLILWLTWMHTRPRSAKMSRNGFIAGLAFGVIATITSVAIAIHIARQITTAPYQLPAYSQEAGQSATSGAIDSGKVTDSPASQADFEATILANGYTPDTDYSSLFSNGHIPQGEWSVWNGNSTVYSTATVSCGDRYYDLNYSSVNDPPWEWFSYGPMSTFDPDKVAIRWGDSGSGTQLQVCDPSAISSPHAVPTIDPSDANSLTMSQFDVFMNTTWPSVAGQTSLTEHPVDDFASQCPIILGDISSHLVKAGGGPTDFEGETPGANFYLLDSSEMAQGLPELLFQCWAENGTTVSATTTTQIAGIEVFQVTIPTFPPVSMGVYRNVVIYTFGSPAYTDAVMGAFKTAVDQAAQ